MVCRFEFSYVQPFEVTPEKWEEARRACPVLQPWDSVYTDSSGKKCVCVKQYVADVRPLIRLGWHLELKGLEQEEPSALAALFTKLETIEERLRSNSPEWHGQTMEQQHFNARVNVHVPGLGLLSIEKVQVQENLCTDALQELLEQGWRILAICPQPDQRRPDYVLGRSESK